MTPPPETNSCQAGVTAEVENTEFIAVARQGLETSRLILLQIEWHNGIA
jgi:hypothetical protein